MRVCSWPNWASRTMLAIKSIGSRIVAAVIAAVILSLLSWAGQHIWCRIVKPVLSIEEIQEWVDFPVNSDDRGAQTPLDERLATLEKRSKERFYQVQELWDIHKAPVSCLATRWDPDGQFRSNEAFVRVNREGDAARYGHLLELSITNTDLNLTERFRVKSPFIFEPDYEDACILLSTAASEALRWRTTALGPNKRRMNVKVESTAGQQLDN